MKKILIFAQGIVAEVFLQKIATKYFNNNSYIIVHNDEHVLPGDIPSSFEVLKFDYTSPFRLEILKDKDVIDIFIVIENIDERFEVYKIVRELYPKVRIVLYNNHIYSSHTINEQGENVTYLSEQIIKCFGLKNDDLHLNVIDYENLVANRLTQRLENVPVIPRGFGLEQGELMEILIHDGSPFAYKKVASIRQKSWHIVGIYRAQELLLHKSSLVILPNDTLLVAGDNKVLNDIYQLAKSDDGQFPAPFGGDIFLYVDALKSSAKKIAQDVSDTLFLHQRLKNMRVFIKVFDALNRLERVYTDELKALDSETIHVELITNKDILEQIKLDSSLRPGLIILEHALFLRAKKMLLHMQIPVLKIGDVSVQDVSKSFLIVDENLEKNQNITTTIFDISKQLNLPILAYEFNQDKEKKDELWEGIESLSKFFNVKCKTMRTNKMNPLLFLRNNNEHVLHFIPLDSSILKNTFFALTSTNAHRINLRNHKLPQIFIPI